MSRATVELVTLCEDVLARQGYPRVASHVCVMVKKLGDLICLDMFRLLDEVIYWGMVLKKTHFHRGNIGPNLAQQESLTYLSRCGHSSRAWLLTSY